MAGAFTVGAVQVMREDINSAAELGADGIVAGMLTREGEIDVAQLSEILLLCRSLACLCPPFYLEDPAPRHVSTAL